MLTSTASLSLAAEYPAGGPVIAGGNTSVMVIHNLDPGPCDIFDDFQIGMPQAKITAK